MSAMQKTNEELLMQVQQSGISNELGISLAQTLRMSDAVKFAKFIPPGEYNDQNLQTIRDCIVALNNLQKYLSLNKESFVHYFVNDTVAYMLSITTNGAKMFKLSKNDFTEFTLLPSSPGALQRFHLGSTTQS